MFKKILIIFLYSIFTNFTTLLNKLFCNTFFMKNVLVLKQKDTCRNLREKFEGGMILEL